MLVILVLLMRVSAHAGDENCRPRNEGITANFRRIETVARTEVNDPCPDHKARDTDEKQSELLDLILAKTKANIAQAMTRAYRFDAAAFAEKTNRLRLFMALKDANVRTQAGPDGRTRVLVVEPKVDLTHGPNFPSEMKPLTPNERTVLNAMILKQVVAANESINVNKNYRARQDLVDELRRMGATGYNEMVTETPALLYADTTRTPRQAFDEYQKDLTIGNAMLPNVQTRPPMGSVVGLVYYTSPVSEIVKEKPEYCGAFHALLSKARVMKRAQNSLSWMASTAMLGCGALGKTPLAWSSLGCAAVVYPFLKIFSVLPSTDFKRQQMMYGAPPEPSAKPAPERARTAEAQ